MLRRLRHPTLPVRFTCAVPMIHPGTERLSPFAAWAHEAGMITPRSGRRLEMIDIWQWVGP